MAIPKQIAPDEHSDTLISLRFKFGIHTIFLLVQRFTPFSAINTELLSVLHDRYPRGLHDYPGDTPQPLPPQDAKYDIAYGILSNPKDDAEGWKDLQVKHSQTPDLLGLKNNDMIAFVIRDANKAHETPEFVAHLPKFDDDEEVGDGDADADENGAADGIDVGNHWKENSEQWEAL